jgi:beta-galactosidase
VPDQWGEAGVKQNGCKKYFIEDPTRPVTVGMDQVKATMESGFGALLDIPGLNYRVHLYEEAFSKFPQGFFGFRNSFNGQL